MNVDKIIGSKLTTKPTEKPFWLQGFDFKKSIVLALLFIFLLFEFPKAKCVTDDIFVISTLFYYSL